MLAIGTLGLTAVEATIQLGLLALDPRRILSEARDGPMPGL